MNGQDTPRDRKTLKQVRILKALCLYALFPLLCLLLLAKPVGNAVRGSEAAAFLIPLAALAAVGLNWLAYTVLRRKRPTLLVFAIGVFWLLAVTVIAYEALPHSEPAASTLAIIAGCLAIAFLYLLSFWFASRRSRPGRVIAVGLWIIIGVISFFILYQAIRDIEIRNVTRDTWISFVILAGIAVAAFSRKIISSARRSRLRNSATAETEGVILQILGETHLDMDEDAVTDYHARVQYEVGGTVYETRTVIAKITWRRFGKKAFVGQKIPVYYDPDDPANAYTDRIDRHFFDSPSADHEKEDG